MTFAAIGLLFASAVIHVGWNLVGKRQHPSAAFLLVANTLGFLCLTPVLVLHGYALAAFPAVVWFWLALTGAFQALYYGSLAAAYRGGDLSVVYPLARSSAVVFVVLLSALLGRGGQMTRTALAGVALIVLGSFLLPLRRLSDLGREGFLAPATALALLAALGTAGYSIVDDLALRSLHDAPEMSAGPLVATALYAFMEGLASSLWLALWVVGQRQGRVELCRVWRKQMRPAGLAGVGIYAAYTLVLLAMAYVSNVGYVVAFRQLSVPLGAVAGIAILGDPPYLPRLMGVGVMFGGLLLVALG
jgi:drug/metabolite transporter (DMT)-like permease